MKKVFILSSVIILLIGCAQKHQVRKLQGYIVYILPNNIDFVETKGRPDTYYNKHFAIENFGSAISFKPNCEIKQLIENIRADTLFDENPELQGYTTFMKELLIFPAEITIADTSFETNDEGKKKFKMIMNKKKVEFNYTEFNSGVIINLIRLE